MARDSTGHDHLPLTPVVFHTLLALSDGRAHGYAIAREVERVTDGRVRMGPGTLYGTLQRLQDEGWIDEAEVPKDAEGRHVDRRRYYRLTPSGRHLVRAEADRLAEVVQMARVKLRP